MCLGGAVDIQDTCYSIGANAASGAPPNWRLHLATDETAFHPDRKPGPSADARQTGAGTTGRAPLRLVEQAVAAVR